MITANTFISHAQNGEDVVLNRVFREIPKGTYVEVGANHPLDSSITRSFYDRGWSGLEIDANPAYAPLFQEQRPRDVFVEAAITDADVSEITFHVIDGTGLSTLVDVISEEHAASGFEVTDVTVPAMRLDAAIEFAGLDHAEIHFLIIDTEGAELEVLHSIDFTRYRPWVLVIEATAPGTTVQRHQSWEQVVLDAGYEFCLFDGLSRFYVSGEKSAELAAGLSYPVCVFDDYAKDDDDTPLREQIRDLKGELEDVRARLQQAEGDVAAVRSSSSWRVTRPLRALSGALRSR